MEMLAARNFGDWHAAVGEVPESRLPLLSVRPAITFPVAEP